MRSVGNRELCVLEHACVICHIAKMIQIDLRQSLFFSATLSPSITMSETQRVTGIVERRLMAIPEVAEVISRIGRGEVGAHTDPVNSAEIAITLQPEETWRTDRGQAGIER